MLSIARKAKKVYNKAGSTELGRNNATRKQGNKANIIYR